MVSKILRRSGDAVTKYCIEIGWEPECVVVAGVGINHQEVDVMREIWPNVSVFGFEPHPATFKRIVDAFPGMLYQLGLSDACRSGVIYAKKRHGDGASIHKKDNEAVQAQCQAIPIELTTLDDWVISTNFEEFPEALLWLDCEGSELAALMGGKAFIPACVLAINVEMTGRPRGSLWCSPLQVHECLESYGFLQAWIHSTRSCIGQYDAVYLRPQIFDPGVCSNPASVRKYYNEKNPCPKDPSVT